MISVSRLSTLFALREGFGIAGAVPTRDNNPGDLRHAPGAQHEPGDPDGIGHFETPEEGWAALEHQLELYANRDHLTIEEAVNRFAPPNENRTADYLTFICQRLPGPPETFMRFALNIGDRVVEEPEDPEVVEVQHVPDSDPEPA